MKKLVIALIVLSLLLVGCDQVSYDYPPPKLSEGAPHGSVPIPEVPASTKEGVVLHKEPPEDMTWISPGKVQVGNFYPGARAEWELLVHNGKDETAEFNVKYRYPNHVGEGYQYPHEEAQDWIIIADTTPVIAPKETREILIVLAMPEDATVFAPKWEFWISVMEVGGVTGAMGIHTELCSRWLVSMR